MACNAVGVIAARIECWALDSTFKDGKFVPVQPAVAVADTVAVLGPASIRAMAGWIVGEIDTELRDKLTSKELPFAVDRVADSLLLENDVDAEPPASARTDTFAP